MESDLVCNHTKWLWNWTIAKQESNLLIMSVITDRHRTTQSPITNWVAPCKPAPNDYFIVIFQVAQNRLKFGMSNLFVLKNVPVVFFFKNAETSGQICVKFNPPPPPPPSLSVSKQRRISIFEGQNTVHVSFTLVGGRLRGGGGGGGGELSRMCLKPCFPACGTKNTGTFFNTKRVDIPNFSRFGATWKITMK